MNIKKILNEESNHLLLTEAGIRIPSGTKSAKILHHDDYDGIWSAIGMGLQLKKQGITKITTDILNDSDDEYQQQQKLTKRKNQMLVVVDFDRFKNIDFADKQIDTQTDHHETDRTDNKGSASKSVGKSNFKSDAIHIATKKAQGFITGTDLDIITGIDSAQFKIDTTDNVATNLILQRELKKNDGAKNKKMRLAIITSSILGQLIRSKSSRNQGAIKSIINNVIEQPSVIRMYSEVKKHIDLQKEQSELLKAYEGKPSGDIDWNKVETFNKKVPKEMKVGIDKKTNTIKKDKNTGRDSAASEEELSKRNQETQIDKELENVYGKPGEKTLRSKDAGDADLPPWEIGKKYAEMPKSIKNSFWKQAERLVNDSELDKIPNDEKLKELFSFIKKPKEKLQEKTKTPEQKKAKIVKIWQDLMSKWQADNSPTILRKTENTTVQSNYKGNRYLAYQDPKVVANIRDFWKFWQMAMRPDYYDKFKKIAAAKGKVFNANEIDLVELGKKAMTMAKQELFTLDELKKRGFENPEKVLNILNKEFDVSMAKSGGHKAITNIDFNPIYGKTYDIYQNAANRAAKLGEKSNPETQKKLKDIEAKLRLKASAFSTLLRQFKEKTQTLLSKAVQGRVDLAKKQLGKTLKESIIQYSK